MMASKIWGYVGLTLLALLSWWVSRVFEPEVAAPTVQAAHQPDYYSNGFSTRVMNPDGTLRRNLIAESMVHYSDDDTTELVSPVMSMHYPDKPPWVIRSATGTVSPDGNDIFLGGDVSITRDSAEGVRAVEVVTRNLYVEQDKEFAETSEEVTVVSEFDRVVAVGMQIFFGKPMRLKFLNNVRGKYAVR